MARQALQKAMDPIWNWASRRYQAAVARQLTKYGRCLNLKFNPSSEDPVSGCFVMTERVREGLIKFGLRPK